MQLHADASKGMRRMERHGGTPKNGPEARPAVR